MTYKEGYDVINNKYDALKAEIEAKELTDSYTAEMKTEELEDNETARQNELDKYDADYKKKTDNVLNLNLGIDYSYIETVIENVDFPAPEPIEADLTKMEKIMEALPATVNNTKFIYLTLDNKYLALKELETKEYSKYTQDYNMITPKYTSLANGINNKYDALKDEIEAKELTDSYTAEMKAEELEDNETARQNELTENEQAKVTEITNLNENYIEIAGKIAFELSQLKKDKETGFIGDVHIHGKLHVDTNVNIEGDLNNIPISDYLTKDDKTELTQLINNIADFKQYDDTELRELINNKADEEHTHNIADITDYQPFDDTEVRTLINTRLPIVNYSTLDEIMTNWRSIPYPSIVFAGDGPESYTSTIVIKQNGGRCLCISTKKTIGDYIWVKFQGTDGRDMWTNSSPWRKIPVLDTTDNIICNNVKSDNEERLKSVENDITILNPYKSMVNNMKLRQDEQMALYGKYTYNTGTGQITEANITTNLMVSGNVSANNIKADNEDRIKALESKLNNMLDMIHPIGSIYRSKSSIPPDTLFGGTWEDITEVNDGNVGTSISNDYTWYRTA